MSSSLLNTIWHYVEFGHTPSAKCELIGQQKNLDNTRGPMNGTKLSQAIHSKHIIINEGLLTSTSVKEGIRKKVYKFANKFGNISISSGKRNLKEQARLMAKMSDKDLNMYGSGPYVAKIKKEAKL